MAESPAFKIFNNTYNRGYSMITKSVKILKLLESLPADPTVAQYNKSTYSSESGRAGIVTVVAAFDNYFTSRFSECVTPILKKEGPTEGLIELLDMAGLDLKGALELLHMQRPHRRIRNLVDNHFSEYTTQKFHVIDNLFLSIGLKDFTSNVEKKAKRSTLNVSIQKLIRRRHVIVHCGDINTHGKIRKIDPYDTKKRMQNIKLFVTKAEELISSRMKKRKKT